MANLLNQSGKVVKIGDRYMDFRKEDIWEVTGWKEPSHPGSTGRVYCKKITNKCADGTCNEREFFPGVLELCWETGSKREETKHPSNYIRIWAEDFETEIWHDYCDVAGVPHLCNNITIWFDQKDVKGECED